MGLLLDMRVVFAQKAGRESSRSAGADEGQKRSGFARETGVGRGPVSPGFRRGLVWGVGNPVAYAQGFYGAIKAPGASRGILTASDDASVVRRRGPEVFELHRTEPIDCLGEPLAERHLWLPVQLLFGQRDVGPPALGIIHRERLLDQLRL
jgi:hypothetical protein